MQHKLSSKNAAEQFQPAVQKNQLPRTSLGMESERHFGANIVERMVTVQTNAGPRRKATRSLTRNPITIHPTIKKNPNENLLDYDCVASKDTIKAKNGGSTLVPVAI